jgi:hypothetical protein
MSPRVVRQKHMVICPAGLGTKNYRAGEGQQQFTDRTIKRCAKVILCHCGVFFHHTCLPNNLHTFLSKLKKLNSVALVRVTAACRRSQCQLLRIEVSRGQPNGSPRPLISLKHRMNNELDATSKEAVVG